MGPTYEEELQHMVDEGRDRSEIVSYMERHNERTIDLEALPKQGHIWVDRGAVMSCENAGHANHHAYKPLK